MRLIRINVSVFLLLVLSNASAIDLPGIPEFIDEMVAKHQFRQSELVNAFQHAEYKQAIIDAMNTPATTKPWADYRAIFINDRSIRDGIKFWRHHARTLRRAERKYGVPQSILVAILGVETRYGQQTGSYRTLDALTTLAFDYPRRAEFFRGELENYLLLARDQDLDLMKVRGSYAGALGIPQFMPSSYRKYAVDFNYNGKLDLLNDPIDAIGSVANYFSQYGWKRGQPVTVQVTVSEDQCVGSLTESRTLEEWKDAGVQPAHKIAGNPGARLVDFTVNDGKEFWLAFPNFDVITSYNNSDYYAMAVYQLSQALLEARENPPAK